MKTPAHHEPVWGSGSRAPDGSGPAETISTIIARGDAGLMSENRRLEKLVGAARDVLERRIRLSVVHPTPKLDQRRSANVWQAYVWLARTADKCLRLRSGAEIIPWSLGLRGSARDAEEDESAAEGTHRRIASLGGKRHGHRHLARHPERTSGPV